MTEKDVGIIWLDTRLLLGRGPFSYVYRGKLDRSKDVAIKRIIVENLPNVRYHQIVNNQRYQREEEALRQLNHPNVRKLLHVEEEYPMRYFALELCAASLYEYCCLGTYTGPMPSEAVVLLHIVRGLRYVHSKGFAHRNIEPKNILISKTLPVTVMLSDFGLSKSVNSVTGSYSVSQDHQIGRGTQLCWMAPELMVTLEDGLDDEGILVTRGSIASDTFSAGCVFFFYLTFGWHPFGYGLYCTQINILNGNPVFLEDLPEEQQRFKSMIKAMISKEPEHRTNLEQVETDLQEMVGPYLCEPELEPIRVMDDDNDDDGDDQWQDGWQDERPDYLM